MTDVKVKDKIVILTDSQRMTYYIDSTDMDKSEFEAWLEGVFLKGISQTLTVFEYVDKGEVGDFEYHIVKFHNVPKKMVNG